MFGPGLKNPLDDLDDREDVPGGFWRKRVSMASSLPKIASIEVEVIGRSLIVAEM